MTKQIIITLNKMEYIKAKTDNASIIESFKVALENNTPYCAFEESSIPANDGPDTITIKDL